MIFGRFWVFLSQISRKLTFFGDKIRRNCKKSIIFARVKDDVLFSSLSPAIKLSLS